MPDNDADDPCSSAKRLYKLAMAQAGLDLVDSDKTDADRKKDDEAVDKARAKVRKECPEKKVTLPGGIVMAIDPIADDDDDLAKAVAILKTIPAKELKGLKGINVRGINENPEPFIAGDYDYTTGLIRIFPYGHDVKTIKHEIGHNVWNNLPKEAKDRWQAFWESGENRKTVAQGGCMPTEYAGKNYREGFAEVYEALRDDDPLLNDKAKQKMKDLLDQLP